MTALNENLNKLLGYYKKATPLGSNMWIVDVTLQNSSHIKFFFITYLVLFFSNSLFLIYFTLLTSTFQLILFDSNIVIR